MEINIKKLGVQKLLFDLGYIIAVSVVGDAPAKYIVDEIFDLFDGIELSSLSVSSYQ